MTRTIALIAALTFCIMAPAASRAAAGGDRPEVMTLPEAAAYLRISEAELDRIAAAGEAPAKRIGAEWRFRREALAAWLAGDWRIVSVAVPPQTAGAPMSAASLAATTGAGDAAPAAAATDRDAIGEAPEGETAEQIFLRGERLLLAPGALSLEAGAFYSRQDSDGLVLLNGNIRPATQERTFFTSSLLARYGLFEDTEAFAGLVYSVEDSKVFSGGRNLGIANDADIGDVRLGMRQTLTREGPWRPGVVLTLEGSAPLKNSSASIGGGLAFVKSYDPAVLFGSVSYRHTFSRDFTNVALLEHKDRIDASFGYTLALNENLSLNSAVNGAFLFGSTFTGARLRSRELFSLDLGMTALLADGFYVEPSVSFGLNGPADDFTLGLTIPYRF